MFPPAFYPRQESRAALIPLYTREGNGSPVSKFLGTLERLRCGRFRLPWRPWRLPRPTGQGFPFPWCFPAVKRAGSLSSRLRLPNHPRRPMSGRDRRVIAPTRPRSRARMPGNGPGRLRIERRGTKPDRRALSLGRGSLGRFRSSFYLSQTKKGTFRLLAVTFQGFTKGALF